VADVFALERERCVFRCDKPGCAIRLDVGPELAREFLQRKLPSGWLRLTANVHYCPVCADLIRNPGYRPVLRVV